MGDYVPSDVVSEEALAAFLHGQELEDIGDLPSALEIYQDVCASSAAASAMPFDCSLPFRTVSPPLPLVVSMALNSLGGAHLDAGRIPMARTAFTKSLRLWASNGMSLMNLGDLERSHGCQDKALAFYERAAALKPLGKSRQPEWVESWLATPRIECVALASCMCILMLHQRDCFDAALPYLRRFNSEYRIAPAVWRLVNDVSGGRREPARIAAPDERVYRYADAVPLPLLATLKQAFAPGAAFWAETNYVAGSYYSFYFDVRQAPSNAVEQLALTLLPLTGCAERIAGVSWWAHSKPAFSSIGHQLHFDTEERTLAATGEVLHPAVTTVCYLQEGVAGADGPHAAGQAASSPTIVYDQRLPDCAVGAQGASVAHVAHPMVDTVLFYPGDRLHCVCPAAPSRPPPPRPCRKRTRSTRGAGSPSSGTAEDSDGEQPDGTEPRDNGESLEAQVTAAARITLMISFWTRALGPKDMPASMRRAAPSGVCAAVPRATRACSWPRSLNIPDVLRAKGDSKSTAAESPDHPRGPRRLAVTEVVNPWQRLAPLSPACDDAAGRSHEHDPWHGLVVPAERDTHFFIRSMADLRGCFGNE